jgi:hypothetical protein
MATVPFNPKVDKITERETVFDFFERSTTGRVLADPDSSLQIFPNNTYLTEIASKLAMMNYQTISENLKNIHTAVIDVASGSTGSIRKSLPYGSTLIKAYSEQSGEDLTECFDCTPAGSVVNCVMSFAGKYNHSDRIKLYYTK